MYFYIKNFPKTSIPFTEHFQLEVVLCGVERYLGWNAKDNAVSDAAIFGSPHPCPVLLVLYSCWWLLLANTGLWFVDSCSKEHRIFVFNETCIQNCLINDFQISFSSLRLSPMQTLPPLWHLFGYLEFIGISLLAFFNRLLCSNENFLGWSVCKVDINLYYCFGGLDNGYFYVCGYFSLSEEKWLFRNGSLKSEPRQKYHIALFGISF